ncbi:hypothetical protein ACIP5Z_05830 [Rothia terrae]|uniref:hypothetical protein n=1 Tax=Rothia terrae TaxID=396015 RepID=UPI0037F2AB13
MLTTSDSSYEDFLSSYSSVIGEMAAMGLAPSEAMSRFRTIFPDAPIDYLNHAISTGEWIFVGRREQPINNVMMASALWYAVAYTLDLEPDYSYTVVNIDPTIMQDVPRMLEMAQVSPESIALVMSKIGAALDYLSQHPYTMVDEATYDEMLENLPPELAEVDQDAVAWPPSRQMITDRLGNGSWSSALLRIGICPPDIDEIEPSVDPSSISEREFRNVLADFLSYCIRYDRKPAVLLYGTWSTDRDHYGKVPTVSAIRARFGSWHNGLQKGRKLINDAVSMGAGKALPVSSTKDWNTSLSIEELAAEGIGVIESAGTSAEDFSASKRWENLVNVMVSRLEELPWMQTLRIYYLSPEVVEAEEYTPFVSVLRAPSGYLCQLTPADAFENLQLTQDTDYLFAHGWSAPDESRPSWTHNFLNIHEAAHAVINAMHFSCGADQVDYYQSDDPVAAPGADVIHPGTGSIPMIVVPEPTVSIDTES